MSEKHTMPLAQFREQFKDGLAILEKLTSEGSPSESRDPAKVVAAVATGSLPVSSAEVGEVVAMLERRAEKLSDPDDTEEDRRYVEALYYCANVLNRHAFYLRRQVEHSTERQPEENNPVGHGLSEAKDVAL